MLVRQHELGLADLDFSVSNAAIGTCHAHDLRGAKCFLVKFDGGGRSLDCQASIVYDADAWRTVKNCRTRMAATLPMQGLLMQGNVVEMFRTLRDICGRIDPRKSAEVADEMRLVEIAAIHRHRGPLHGLAFADRPQHALEAAH